MDEMLSRAPDEILRSAGHRLMDVVNIWNDKVKNKEGHFVDGPDKLAVFLIMKLASDIRAGVTK